MHDGSLGFESVLAESFAVRVMSEGWSTYPNLRMGANSSRNRGRGRLQVQVRRAFLVAGSNELTTSQVYDYALPRVRADMWRQMHRCSVLRVLDQLCHRVGRDRAHGAIIWKLKEPLE